MQPRPASPGSASPPPALSAFLRGIERRAFVFAQVQCGDEAQALQALARATAAFGGLAATSPLSAWPAGFWAQLLAQPELGRGGSVVPELAGLGQGPRAALLLRLVAGLDFPHAAAVLGVEEATYRYALQRALQQLGDGGISFAALSGLRERLHRQVKTLPAARTDALARLREQALAAPPPQAGAPGAAPAAAAPRRRWPLRLAWSLLALLALAFAATFVPRTPQIAPGDTRPLPEAPRPAPRPVAVDADLDHVSHPDYAQLAAPADGPVAADLALLSWLEHGQEIDVAAVPDAGTEGAAGDLPGPVAAPEAFADLPEAVRRRLPSLAATWAGLDAATRDRLLANALHWEALDAAGREALAARMREWDQSPAPARARQRAPFAAWQRLPAEEQARLRAVHAAWVVLPEPEREALRARFDALPAEQRRDWWLGPTLGADFAGLQPLVAFVPDEEIAPVLDMLRGLPPATRGELATLVRRLSAGQREALRRALLESPAADRAALVRERLGR